jgi:hypothetical protein
MKRVDLLAIAAVVAMVFVALLVHMLSPKQSVQVVTAGETPKAEVPERPLSLCKTLLQAAIDGDYKGFRSECFKEGDRDMKLALAQAGAKEAFQRASETIAPLCREGYELQFLGSMAQEGSDICLWKLIPAAGQNQFLVRLSLRNGKISGFFFQ